MVNHTSKRASATALVAMSLLSFGFAPVLTAQDEAPARPKIFAEEGKGTVSFSMGKEPMQLVDFVKWAQEMTGKRFTYNAQELVAGANGGNGVHFLGTFTFKRDEFKEDFFSFFQTMLYIKGFALVPRGTGDLELLEIVMMTGTRGREVSSGARYVAPESIADYRHQAGVPVLTSVPLKHINAQLANNALRPFFASVGGGGNSVQIGNVGNKSSLLLQGFGPQVYAAMQVLKIADAPPTDPEHVMHVVALKHLDPTELKPVLDKLLQQDAKARTAELAQPVAKKPAEKKDDNAETISFSMKKDGMELPEFIEWAQEVTGKRFTFNRQELMAGHSGSKVNFIGSYNLRRDSFRDDFFSFVQTMLYIKGFAIIPRGEGDRELLQIVMMTGTRGREIAASSRYVAIEDLEKYRHQAGVPILTAAPLKYINAQFANNALRPFFASTGGTNRGSSLTIGNVGNKSSLLLQGFGPQVYAAVQMLKLADKPNPGVQIKTSKKTSSLLLTGKPENVKQAIKLIAKLDKAPKKEEPKEVIREPQPAADDIEEAMRKFLREVKTKPTGGGKKKHG